jgi:hypothetical protein
MRVPRVRFTIRRMMVAVVVLAVASLAARSWWEAYLERVRVRQRLLRQQQLLRMIGPGNNAVGGPVRSRPR